MNAETIQNLQMALHHVSSMRFFSSQNFSPFIQSVFTHYFRFSTKESAAHAIVATHNTEVAGHTVKCSWGKESGDPNNIHTNAQVAMQVSISSSLSL